MPWAFICMYIINRDQNLSYETLTVIIAKLFGELYQVLSLSYCASTACRSFIYFKLVACRFQLNENVKMLCLYCMIQKVHLRKDQWGKLRCDFPVVTLRHYGERAVSFKKVNLPELL